MKKIIILGSTGSIGRRCLDVCRDFADRLAVVGLSTHRNVPLLEKQIEEFHPEGVAIADETLAEEAQRLRQRYGISVFSGAEGLKELVLSVSAHTVLIATVGIAGLVPTISAIEAGLDIALANKEVLVAGGELVMQLARNKGVNIIPVDSEHSAILQCIAGQSPNTINRIILTASGGPFRERTIAELNSVTIEDALAHPVWSMGKKITIDSATLMNKGFEVIECKHLFNVDIDQVDVVIHPQSIVHSMVEFTDGSILAQLSVADMYLPIQIALSWPERWQNTFPRLDICKLRELTFERPDREKFPCLEFAYESARIGGTMPVVLNAANEVAVRLFLNKKVSFTDIPIIIKSVMKKHKVIQNPGLPDILSADSWARDEAENYAH